MSARVLQNHTHTSLFSLVLNIFRDSWNISACDTCEGAAYKNIHIESIGSFFKGLRGLMLISHNTLNDKCTYDRVNQTTDRSTYTTVVY